MIVDMYKTAQFLEGPQCSYIIAVDEYIPYTCIYMLQNLSFNETNN